MTRSLARQCLKVGDGSRMISPPQRLCVRHYFLPATIDFNTLWTLGISICDILKSKKFDPFCTWHRATTSAFSANKSTSLPLPSSPHWAPEMQERFNRLIYIQIPKNAILNYPRPPWHGCPWLSRSSFGIPHSLDTCQCSFKKEQKKTCSDFATEFRLLPPYSISLHGLQLKWQEMNLM